VRKLLTCSATVLLIGFCNGVFAKDICVKVDTAVDPNLGKFKFNVVKPLKKFGQVAHIEGINKFANPERIYPISGTAVVASVDPETKTPEIHIGFTVFRDTTDVPYIVQGKGSRVDTIVDGNWFIDNGGGKVAWSPLDCKEF